MKRSITAKIIVEAAAVLSLFLLYLLAGWRLWIARQVIFTHDSISWYGIFAYFVKSLYKGVFPYWNPFENCGEIFFLCLSILRLDDPFTLILLMAGKLLKVSPLSLYHYDFLLRYFIFIAGSYLFFRHIARHKISAFIATMIMSFSSLGIIFMRQNAFIFTIYLLPWILLFIFKLLETKNFRYLPSLAFLLGIMVTCYSAMFTVTFIVVLLAVLWLLKGLPKPGELEPSGNRKVIFASVLIFLFISLRVISLGLASRDIIPTLRTLELTHQAYSQPIDFLNLFAPYAFKWYFYISNLAMSECFLYIGLTGLLFSLVGLFFSGHRYKNGFLLMTIFVGLLMLGNKTPVYVFMQKFFPFFSTIRHMHTFGPFFLFCLVYFSCIGIDVIFERFYNTSHNKPGIRLFEVWFCSFIILIAALVTASIFYISYAARGYSGYILPERIRFFTVTFTRESFYNALFFIFAGIIVFFLLIKSRKRCLKRIGVFCLMVFILSDLLFFNYCLSGYLTEPRDRANLSLSLFERDITYKNFRNLWPPDTFLFRYYSSAANLSVSLFEKEQRGENFRAFWQPDTFPFRYYSSAITGDFAAHSYFNASGSHFYEMKDYCLFDKSSLIPEYIKNMWMGVTAPKLRLAANYNVVSFEHNVEMLHELDYEKALNRVFIEQDIPAAYSYLRRDITQPADAAADLGEVEVQSFGPNELLLNVNAKRDCFLYYSDGYDKNWYASIDGADSNVYKANMAFKMVIIPQGQHIVRFFYNPIFYKISLLSYFTGVLIFVFVIIKRNRFSLQDEDITD